MWIKEYRESEGNDEGDSEGERERGKEREIERVGVGVCLSLVHN